MTQTTRSLKELEKTAELFPPLSKTEEEKLARRAASGDKHAQELLFLHNSRRVLFFAKMLAFGSRQPMKEALSYYKGVLTIDDAISEAMMGLWKAIHYFDPDRYSPVAKKKVNFSAWANFIMRQHLRGVAVKKQKEVVPERFEDWKQDKMRGLPVVDPDKKLAEDRFWDLFMSLSNRDQMALLKKPRNTNAYKNALTRLKNKTTEKEWEEMLKLLYN